MPYEIVKPPSKPWLESLTYNAFLSCRGHGVINEAGCWDDLVGMTLGPSTLPRYQRVGGPVRSLLPFKVINALRLHRGGQKA